VPFMCRVEPRAEQDERCNNDGIAMCVRAAEHRTGSSMTSIRRAAGGRKPAWQASALALSLVSCADGVHRPGQASAGAWGAGAAGMTADAGTAGTTADAGTAGTTANAGTAGTTSQAGTAATTADAGTAGTTSQAGTAATSQAGTAGTSQGGTAGTTSQAGTAGTAAHAGAAGCPQDEVGQSCFLCQDHWICGADFPKVDPTPEDDGCYLSGLPGRNLLWQDGTITADGVVVGKARGAGMRLVLSYPDGAQWLFCARAP